MSRSRLSLWWADENERHGRVPPKMTGFIATVQEGAEAAREFMKAHPTVVSVTVRHETGGRCAEVKRTEGA